MPVEGGTRVMVAQAIAVSLFEPLLAEIGEKTFSTVKAMCPFLVVAWL
jgi:hypothetical protein